MYSDAHTGLHTELFKVKGLQVYVQRPTNDLHPEVAVVAVHQCSALGGSAAAVDDIASSVCAQGMLTVSFDLRGAGNSSGCCCMWPVPCVSGCPEVADVVAVAAWVREELQRDVWILGVSAGGPVGAGAIDALECIRGYMSVAYTFGLVTTLLFAPQTVRVLGSAKPKLFIMGNHDMFTSLAAFRLCMGVARRPRSAVLVPGAGHFDLEYSPLARLDAELAAAFVRGGGSLPARLEGGAVHLSAARGRHYAPSLWTGGPCCILTIIVVLWVVATQGGFK